MQGLNHEYHIQCSAEDIGRYVILPGDPGRVHAIASLLDKPRSIGMYREFNIWTGFLAGEQVTVCSTGMGGPSTAICVEELHHLGADTFIRCGTCGGIDLNVKSGDIVVASGAIRFEHTSLEYAPLEYPAVSDFFIAHDLYSASVDLGYNTHIGISQCKDSFYGQHDPELSPVFYELKNKWESWKRLGVKCSEMETAALFVIADALHVRAGACFHVVWNQEREAAGLPQERSSDTTGAIRVAVEGMRRVILADKKTK